MTHLQTLTQARETLANATDDTREQAQAAYDAASRNQRREEILALEPGPTRDALLAPLGTTMEPVHLPPEPTDEERALAKYLLRSQQAGRVMARWAAINDLRLASGAWARADLYHPITGLLADPHAGAAIKLLQALAFGDAAGAIAACQHAIATNDVRQAYLDAMAAEGALPPPAE